MPGDDGRDFAGFELFQVIPRRRVALVDLEDPAKGLFGVFERFSLDVVDALVKDLLGLAFELGLLLAGLLDPLGGFAIGDVDQKDSRPDVDGALVVAGLEDRLAFREQFGDALLAAFGVVHTGAE